MNTAKLLADFETCPRKAFWSQEWEKNKMTPAAMLDEGIRAGLTYYGQDHGEEAGSVIFEIGATRGIDSSQYDVHAEVVHLANLADVICTAARKNGDPPWKSPDPIEGWNPSCFISPDGHYLRRIVCVSSWSDERQNSLCRSWETLGPVAFYDLPMQIAVAIIGNRKDGKYHSFWTHALQHPQNKKLRFRKKTDIATGFKSSWLECWREDHDEFSSADWLNAMMGDDVLRDVFFKIDFPRQEEFSRRRIMDVANRKMDIIQSTKTLPDEQFTGCNWPTKCQFINPCSKGDRPSGKYGFVPVEQLVRSA